MKMRFLGQRKPVLRGLSIQTVNFLNVYSASISLYRCIWEYACNKIPSDPEIFAIRCCLKIECISEYIVSSLEALTFHLRILDALGIAILFA